MMAARLLLLNLLFDLLDLLLEILDYLFQFLHQLLQHRLELLPERGRSAVDVVPAVHRAPNPLLS